MLSKKSTKKKNYLFNPIICAGDLLGSKVKTFFVHVDGKLLLASGESWSGRVILFERQPDIRRVCAPVMTPSGHDSSGPPPSTIDFQLLIIFLTSGYCTSPRNMCQITHRHPLIDIFRRLSLDHQSKYLRSSNRMK